MRLTLKDLNLIFHKLDKFSTFDLISGSAKENHFILNYMSGKQIQRNKEKPDIVIIDCNGDELENIINMKIRPTIGLIVCCDKRHSPYGKKIRSNIVSLPSLSIGQPLVVIGQEMLNKLFTPTEFSGNCLIGRKGYNDPEDPGTMYIRYLSNLSQDELKVMKREFLNGWDGQFKYENLLLHRYFEKKIMENIPKPSVKQITMTTQEIDKYKIMLENFNQVRRNDPERIMNVHMDNPKLVKALQKYREQKRNNR